MSFKKGFLWGAATSSYQIEGGAFEDGKGESVWDNFCRKENTVWRGQNGDTACDHYHRYNSDVKLMKKIGLQAYRFSIAWPRILPEGTGKINARGLDFYSRLVDSLLDAGIAPFVTLFHWDYPLALYRRGGWLNSESPDWFAEYAGKVTEKLSDRVRHWMTHNEPQCFILLGHQSGAHAPGDKLGWREVLLASHHALLAHGKAVQAMRAAARQPLSLGYAPIGMASIPATTRPADVRAARAATFGIASRNLWNSAWWMDPVILGRYPADGIKQFGKDMPRIGPNDMKTIAQPLDFLGVNIYQSPVVRAGKGGKPEPVAPPMGSALTAFRWEVTPDSLYWGPKFFHERYKTPLYITENGLSSMDWPALDGRVHDPGRIDFLARYLGALKRATGDGVDVRGYFQWSLMDNFEWAEGYKERFGLTYVDFITQERILKDSALWYRKVIASNGRTL